MFHCFRENLAQFAVFLIQGPYALSCFTTSPFTHEGMCEVASNNSNNSALRMNQNALPIHTRSPKEVEQHILRILTCKSAQRTDRNGPFHPVAAMGVGRCHHPPLPQRTAKFIIPTISQAERYPHSFSQNIWTIDSGHVSVPRLLGRS